MAKKNTGSNKTGSKNARSAPPAKKKGLSAGAQWAIIIGIGVLIIGALVFNGIRDAADDGKGCKPRPCDGPLDLQRRGRPKHDNQALGDAPDAKEGQFLTGYLQRGAPGPQQEPVEPAGPHQPGEDVEAATECVADAHGSVDQAEHERHLGKPPRAKRAEAAPHRGRVSQLYGGV